MQAYGRRPIQKRRRSSVSTSGIRRGRARTPGLSTARSVSRYETPIAQTARSLPRTPSVAAPRTYVGDLPLPGQSTTSTQLPQERSQHGFNADLDEDQEVIMAVDVTDRGSIGCAYYVARDEKLCMMEDIQLGGVEMVDGRMCLMAFMC